LYNLYLFFSDIVAIAEEKNDKPKLECPQYFLEYITDNHQFDEMQDTHITDIENYKQQLDFYPASEGTHPMLGK
jgi:hypothetical protein